MRGFERLIVIGFAAEAKGRELIENCEGVVGIPAIYVQATPDLIMSDLLKNMRSSQIFSVCGLPEIKLRRLAGDNGERFEVQLLGLDTFDPVSMQTHHVSGNDVPAWFLDCDYNELCFHVSQAFFPRIQLRTSEARGCEPRTRRRFGIISRATPARCLRRASGSNCGEGDRREGQ